MIQIKNAAELQKMRKACAISAAALKAGGEAIEPGITTAEIDKIIYDFIVRHGARPNFLHLYGFPATACISVNDTVIHGIPNKQQQIRPGDIVPAWNALAKLPPDERLAIVREYMRDDDPLVIRSYHRLGLLTVRFDALRLKLSGLADPRKKVTAADREKAATKATIERARTKAAQKGGV